MDWNENIRPFLKEHSIALVFGAIGLICLGYGLISLSHPQSTDDSQFQNIQTPSGVSKNPPSPVFKQITIDVEGAVEKSGVYKVTVDSRIQDALIAAGGLSQSADRHQVVQNLNLASPLIDGAKFYIPAVGEQMTGSNDTSNSSPSTVQEGSNVMVNINQASESELNTLPGIEPVTAQKIISNRPYQSTQNILNKKAVGASEFTKIKDQISVY
jgi:competence protein ComEA